MTFTVFVPGKAAPQGSKRHVGHGRMIETSPNLRPWRDLIVTICLDELLADPANAFRNAVAVSCTFNFDRPKHHFGTGKNTGLLKDAAPLFPRAGAGDLDKLCRAVFDALGSKHGAGVIADDADVVALIATKFYADRENPTGCTITVQAATR